MKTFVSTFLVAILAVTHWGCSSLTYSGGELDRPGMTLSVVGAPPVRDARARYRQIFCQLLEQDHSFQNQGDACDRFLWHLNDEAAPMVRDARLPAHDNRYTIMFVAGLFEKCAWRTIKPFQAAAKHLRGQGYHTDWVDVSGLAGSDYNAEHIAGKIAETPLADGDSLILIGHSKGAVDILHFLVRYPNLAERVSAVISVAGAINGSPIADALQGAWPHLLGAVPQWLCPPSDYHALDSLQRTVRLNWLAEHPLPESVHYFSIAGFTPRDNISNGLLSTYDRLKSIDPRNDGLLLYYDQVIPGSNLLGYANADHWAISMPMEDNSPVLSKTFMNKNRYPRATLVEAAIRFAVESIDSHNHSGGIAPQGQAQNHQGAGQ